MQPTTLAQSTGSDPVPGINTPRARGPEIQVTFAPGQGSNSSDVRPSVAAIPSGTIAVSWHRNPSQIQNRNIMVRFFDREGAPLSPSQGLVAAGATPTGVSHVAGSSAGQFVAVWEEISPSTLLTNVVAQRFNGSGQPTGFGLPS